MPKNPYFKALLSFKIMEIRWYVKSPWKSFR